MRASRRQGAVSPEHPPITVALLEPHHLPAALAIQAQVYPPFLVEAEGVFLARMAMAASFCMAAMQGPTLVGYLVAHGWRRRSPPPLGALLADEGRADILYIHDLAIAPSARGLKIGERLVGRAFAMAADMGLEQAELIAVEGAASYWRGLGFVEGDAAGDMRATLDRYGASARWMTRDIA